MNEKHSLQVEDIEDCFNGTLGKLVAKYAVRIAWMIIVFSFAAGGWAAKLQSDVNAIRQSQAETKADVKELKMSIEATNAATTARIVDWNRWRVAKDIGEVSYERRLAWLENAERTRTTK